MTNDQKFKYTLSEIEAEWSKVVESFDRSQFNDQLSYETTLFNEFKKSIGDVAFSNFEGFIYDAMWLSDEDLKKYRQSILNITAKIF
jgi:hypothetical protein